MKQQLIADLIEDLQSAQAHVIELMDDHIKHLQKLLDNANGLGDSDLLDDIVGDIKLNELRRKLVQTEKSCHDLARMYRKELIEDEGGTD